VEVHESSETAERLAIITGGAGDDRYMEEAYSLGCDTFVTGEGSMYRRLFARERQMNLAMASHYSTETPATHRFAREVGQHFQLETIPIEDSID
jgi:putative NIF3 family GTP cyclohydrolase 1 type 2